MNRISVIKYVFHAPTGFPARAACTLREPQLASLNANRTSHRRNIRLKALNLNATLLLLFLATIFILIDHSSLATRFDLLHKYIIFWVISAQVHTMMRLSASCARERKLKKIHVRFVHALLRLSVNAKELWCSNSLSPPSGFRKARHYR